MEEFVQKVEEPKLKSKNMFIIAIALVVILLGSLGGYLFYYIKTPTYSLNMIREAIQKHDLATFNKHVDTETLLSRGFDDLIASNMEKETDTAAKSFAAGFVQMLKPPIVSALNDGIKRFVETGKFEEANKADENKDENRNISPQNIAKRTGFDKSQFKGIAYTKKDGKTAIVGINLFDKQLAKEFVLDIKMRELDDGTWQIAELSNLKEYIQAIEKAQKAKLAELNKPIQAQLSQAISIGSINCRVVPRDSFGFSNDLLAKIPRTIQTDKAIVELKGILTVKDSNDNLLFTGSFSSQNTSAKGKEATMTFRFNLNQFIKEQKTLMNLSADSMKPEVSITSLKYDDGTTVELYKELPEE
ncbi:MAG: hypothetical protein H6Q70_915 [Firmicutes bacterium]|nr:hypothetical protein [Bacillota bacterium]